MYRTVLRAKEAVADGIITSVQFCKYLSHASCATFHKVAFC